MAETWDSESPLPYRTQATPQGQPWGKYQTKHFYYTENIRLCIPDSPLLTGLTAHATVQPTFKIRALLHRLDIVGNKLYNKLCHPFKKAFYTGRFILHEIGAIVYAIVCPLNSLHYVGSAYPVYKGRRAADQQAFLCPQKQSDKLTIQRFYCGQWSDDRIFMPNHRPM